MFYRVGTTNMSHKNKAHENFHGEKPKFCSIYKIVILDRPDEYGRYKSG